MGDARPLRVLQWTTGIPAVCAAAPGIRTYADLPLPSGHLGARQGRAA